MLLSDLKLTLTVVNPSVVGLIVVVSMVVIVVVLANMVVPVCEVMMGDFNVVAGKLDLSALVDSNRVDVEVLALVDVNTDA